MAKKGFVVAGLAGGSGKSVVSVGLAAALVAAGKNVVPFKKGPDYIDAGWLALGAGHNCYNLDPYLMTQEAILQSYHDHSQRADVCLVEGNRGLYDGVNVDGGYSTAELAITLDLPVLLVVNCTKTTRTVAAMVMGCQHFDERVVIKGVILNQIATNRQRRLISDAVEHYTGIPVLGSIPRLKKDIFPMRHLGMIPHQEYQDSGGAIETLAGLVKENVDLQQVETMMKPIEDSSSRSLHKNEIRVNNKVKIGVLQDAAFQFYYTENIEALEHAGAQLVYVDAMRDTALPELDGLYIGGGFPETSAGQLAANENFRRSVKAFAEAGLPIYAECGGLIYLGRSITLNDDVFSLAGIFPIDFGMSVKPQAHGYTVFQVERENPFYKVGTEVKGHEFRYSTVLSWDGEDSQLAVKMSRGKGFRGERDGLTYKNVLAMYTHIHAGGTLDWASNFVSCCQTAKTGH